MTIKSLVNLQRERCRPCGMKLQLTENEAKFLTLQDQVDLVAYFCPCNNGWHIARADDERLRDGRLDYDG